MRILVIFGENNSFKSLQHLARERLYKLRFDSRKTNRFVMGILVRGKIRGEKKNNIFIIK